MKRIRLLPIFYLLLVLLTLSSCAYFNTFYNAREYFDEAEERRLEKVGEATPKAALDSYAKVIEKSQRVLDKYPDSRYRSEAILLMGISHFYRNEIRKAEVTFKILEEQSIEFENDAAFWQALCKWKLGKVQPALNELEELQNSIDDAAFKAKVLLARADIQLEEGLKQEAFVTLEKAAELTRDPNERSQIYYQVASLAMQYNDYELAYRANRQVLKNTTSKQRMITAHLNIVKIRRAQQNLDEVESLVKSLLADDQNSKIHGELVLELGRTYFETDDLLNSVEQFGKVIKDYPKTIEAAEALFILGEMQLFYVHDLDSALAFFDRATKENRNLPQRKKIQSYKKDIKLYTDETEKLDQNIILLNKPVTAKTDSISVDSLSVSQPALDTLKVVDDIAGSLFTLGRLEAFNFNQPELAYPYFNDIIDYYADTDYYPKTLFTLSYLRNQSGDPGDSLLAQSLHEILLLKFPDSEYADFILEKRGIAREKNSSEKMLLEAELTWHGNSQASLKIYKNILNADTTSETSAKAAYFLGYHYDHTFHEIDSALYYYQQLEFRHGQSEQYQGVSSRLRELQLILNPEPLQEDAELAPADSSGNQGNEFEQIDKAAVEPESPDTVKTSTRSRLNPDLKE